MPWHKKLAAAFDDTGVARAEWAARIGVHVNTFNNYLSGRTNPHPPVLWRLCQLAGVSVDWVLDDSQPMIPRAAPPPVEVRMVAVREAEPPAAEPTPAPRPRGRRGG